MHSLNHVMDRNDTNTRGSNMQSEELIDIGEAIEVRSDFDASPQSCTLPYIYASPRSTHRDSDDACVTPEKEELSCSGYFESTHFTSSNVTNYVSSTEFIKSDSLEKHDTVEGLLISNTPPNSSRLSPLQKITSSPSKFKQKNTVKRVIVLNPGDDPEKATAKAINDIADSLNKKAAERLAQGHTPEKETVIEITRILAPAEGYFSKEHFANKHEVVNLPELKAANQAAPVSSALLNSKPNQWRPSPPPKSQEETKHQHHRRKSPHPKKHMYTSPTPPKSQPHCANDQMDSDQWYFATSPRNNQCKRTNPLHHSTPVLHVGNGARRAASQSLQSLTGSSLNLGSSHKSLRSKTGQGAGGRAPAILRAGVKHPKPPPQPADTSSLAVAGTAMHNQSLKNIQWLSDYQLGAGSTRQTSKILTTEKHMEKFQVHCEFGQKKRPPYSYMHLIQMAICSRADCKMTLREIYSWIEDKFPYYKYSANQGWKNSIRHNLSLYDIFVRVKPKQPGKSSFSYWTLRDDVPNKATKVIHDMISRINSKTDAEKTCTQITLSSDARISVAPVTNAKSRKGPVPLLPKPVGRQVQGQTFALIPIHSGIPVISNQPVMLSQQPQAPSNLNTSEARQRSLERKLISSKRNLSPHEEPSAKLMKTNCRVNMLSGGKSSSVSDWESCRSTPSPVIISPSLSSSLDTSELRHQLSQIKVDSGVDFVSETSSLSDHTPSSSQGSSGLPRPVMYPIKPAQTGGDAGETLGDSLLDEGSIQSMLGNIEQELSSPMQELLRTPPPGLDDKADILMSSTPFRNELGGSMWSPITGLTPLATKTSVDSLLFTPPEGSHKRTSTPNEPRTPENSFPREKTPDISPSSLPFLRNISPDSSLDQKPDKNSFAKILSDIHLDSMIDEGINADVSNLSFSVFQ